MATISCSSNSSFSAYPFANEKGSMAAAAGAQGAGVAQKCGRISTSIFDSDYLQLYGSEDDVALRALLQQEEAAEAHQSEQSLALALSSRAVSMRREPQLGGMVAAAAAACALSPEEIACRANGGSAAAAAASCDLGRAKPLIPAASSGFSPEELEAETLRFMRENQLAPCWFPVTEERCAAARQADQMLIDRVNALHLEPPAQKPIVPPPEKVPLEERAKALPPAQPPEEAFPEKERVIALCLKCSRMIERTLKDGSEKSYKQIAQELDILNREAEEIIGETPPLRRQEVFTHLDRWYQLKKEEVRAELRQEVRAKNFSLHAWMNKLIFGNEKIALRTLIHFPLGDLESHLMQVYRVLLDHIRQKELTTYDAIVLWLSFLDAYFLLPNRDFAPLKEFFRIFASQYKENDQFLFCMENRTLQKLLHYFEKKSKKPQVLHEINDLLETLFFQAFNRKPFLTRTYFQLCLQLIEEAQIESNELRKELLRTLMFLLGKLIPQSPEPAWFLFEKVGDATKARIYQIGLQLSQKEDASLSNELRQARESLESFAKKFPEVVKAPIVPVKGESEITERNFESLRKLAESWVRDKPMDALHLANKLLAVEPDNPFLWSLLARSNQGLGLGFFAINNFVVCMDCHDNRLQKEPGRHPAIPEKIADLSNLILLAYQFDEVLTAEDYLSPLLDILATYEIKETPFFPEIFIERGKALRRLGFWDDAFTNYRDAFKLHPDESELALGLAECYSHFNQQKEAAKYRALALKLQQRQGEDPKVRPFERKERK